MTNNKHIYTNHQLEMLKCIVDCLIPAKGPMPSAATVGTVEFISAATIKSPQSSRLMIEGFTQIDIMAQKQGLAYVNLTKENQKEIIQSIESNHTEFFKLLLKETYNCYYTNPSVLKLIGLPGRPPQPLGYELHQGNLDLLESVSARGEIWRKV